MTGWFVVLEPPQLYHSSFPVDFDVPVFKLRAIIGLTSD
jgi:hypothetical protein